MGATPEVKSAMIHPSPAANAPASQGPSLKRAVAGSPGGAPNPPRAFFAEDKMVDRDSSLPSWVYPRTRPTVDDGRFIRVDPDQADRDTPVKAIQLMNDRITKAGGEPLISRKVPSNWPSLFAACFGGSVTVDQNSLGFYHQQAAQRVIVREGRYPMAGPFRSWDQNATASLAETHIARGNFTCTRLNQNTVAVVQEPSGETFILTNGTAISFGNYRVLERIQPNNLSAGNPVECLVAKEKTKEQAVLGYVRRVVDSNNEIAATFLQVQPNCVAVVSRNNEMKVLKSGAWVFTEKNVNLKGFFNESLATHEMDEQQVRTADNIYVTISLYLQWRLIDPLILASKTSYDSPVAALKDGIEANLTHVVGNLHFQNLQGMRDTSGSPVNGEQQSKLLGKIQEQCFKELKDRARSMGIELTTLEIRKNRLDGEIVNKMNALAVKNTDISNTASTIDRENENNMKAQDNLFNIAQRQAQTNKVTAEGEANRARMIAEGARDAEITRAEGAQKAQVLAAEGDRQAKVAAAKAQQEVVRLQTEAEVSRIKAIADAKRLESLAIAEGKKAIADAEVYLARTRGAAEDGFGEPALRLHTQRLQNENSKALSEHFKVSILPSNGQGGDVNPVLNAVIGASVMGAEFAKPAIAR